ncbi:MAG: hypothetical protein H8D22_09155 [Candidatus Cloacimonetes bacterium]|nr:hypothetical protein [Candidatus Cloacimonadota bacterium]
MNSFRVIRLIILIFFFTVILYKPVFLHGGLKLGLFSPTNSEFPTSFAVGFDGRFNITKKFKLVFEVLYVHEVTGKNFIYSKFTGSGFKDIKSDILLMNIMLSGVYYCTENIYCGLGLGYFFTRSTKLLWDLEDNEWYSYSGNVDEPEAPAYQLVVGYMQKPTKMRKHFLLFCELKYLSQIGEGTLEVEKNKFEKFSNFSGFSLLFGFTF